MIKSPISPIKITVLGTGTSQGVPVIGCDCAVCSSKDRRDRRLRVAILINIGEKNLLIDAGPDFRQQMLRANVSDIDAILLTHEHYDHVAGLDDVRPINFRYKKDMPIYGLQRVLENIKVRFDYAFSDNPYPGAPQYILHETMGGTPITIEGMEVLPLDVMHGNLPILGFRIANFAYLTDVKTIPERTFEQLKGVKHLIINALHHNPHHSHLNLQECLEVIARIAPKKAYLTHISHNMGKHAAINAILPKNVRLAYDGMTLALTTSNILS
jgi:phosphoribosyl 1,2-cyclic phosphate phosphodiesterase